MSARTSSTRAPVRRTSSTTTCTSTGTAPRPRTTRAPTTVTAWPATRCPTASAPCRSTTASSARSSRTRSPRSARRPRHSPTTPRHGRADLRRLLQGRLPGLPAGGLRDGRPEGRPDEPRLHLLRAVTVRTRTIAARVGTERSVPTPLFLRGSPWPRHPCGHATDADPARLAGCCRASCDPRRRRLQCPRAEPSWSGDSGPAREPLGRGAGESVGFVRGGPIDHDRSIGSRARQAWRSPTPAGTPTPATSTSRAWRHGRAAGRLELSLVAGGGDPRQHGDGRHGPLRLRPGHQRRWRGRLRGIPRERARRWVPPGPDRARRPAVVSRARTSRARRPRTARELTLTLDLAAMTARRQSPSARRARGLAPASRPAMRPPTQGSGTLSLSTGC